MGNGDFPLGLAIIVVVSIIGIFFIWAVILGLVLIGAF